MSPCSCNPRRWDGRPGGQAAGRLDGRAAGRRGIRGLERTPRLYSSALRSAWLGEGARCQARANVRKERAVPCCVCCAASAVLCWLCVRAARARECVFLLGSGRGSGVGSCTNCLGCQLFGMSVVCVASCVDGVLPKGVVDESLPNVRPGFSRFPSLRVVGSCARASERSRGRSHDVSCRGVLHLHRLAARRRAPHTP